MNELYEKNKLFFLILITGAVGFLVWYFSAIIICILAAAVLSIMGQPVVEKLNKVRFSKYRIPNPVSVALTLLLFIVVFFGLLSFIIPLVVKEANLISSIDPGQFVAYFQEDMNTLQSKLIEYGIIAEHGTIISTLKESILQVMNVQKITGFLSNIFAVAGKFMFYFFTVIFLAFFLLKEPEVFPRLILMLVPDKYHRQMANVMVTSKSLLRRYFLGLFAEVFSLSLLIAVGLLIIGVPGALAIGFFAGVMNIIPYLGYFIATVIGVLLAITGVISAGDYEAIVSIAVKTLGVMVIANMIDNSLFQPFFFGKSVKAHPVEIFLVIIAAGFIGGVLVMIVAVPVYTFLRIVAKEFLSQFRIIRSLTKTI
jgi:predicted PurR-regulated permease PerM